MCSEVSSVCYLTSTPINLGRTRFTLTNTPALHFLQRVDKDHGLDSDPDILIVSDTISLR